MLRQLAQDVDAAEADGGIAHKGNVWAMATFQNGPPPLLGDGLRMLFSEDGFVWEEPAGAPIVLRPSDVGARVLRDPSVQDDTTGLCSTA